MVKYTEKERSQVVVNFIDISIVAGRFHLVLELREKSEAGIIWP